MFLAKKNSKQKKIKDYKKFLKRYIKWNWKLLSFFIFDLVLFGAIVSSFVFVFATVNLSNATSSALKYFILFGSFYILLKFTFTNFFHNSIYYKRMVIFKKEIIIEKIKFTFCQKIELASLVFLTTFIFMNIITTVILNYEYDVLFEKQNIVKAIVTTLTDLLLIPSFVASLNKIFAVKTNTNTNYKCLIRDQFLVNSNLFINVKPVNDYEYIEFANLKITSKKGIFLLTNYKDSNIKNKVLQENKNIIKEYNEIWQTYCEYLAFINGVNVRGYNKYLTFYIERKFDAIFINFLDL